MSKILVVGFPRSGTSLTNRIFNRHPDVSKMLFEKWLLKHVASKRDIPKIYPKMVGDTYGEKVIWGKRTTGKNTNQTIYEYCLKWNEMFGVEAKIIQIIRHPYDTLNSLVTSKRRLPRGPRFEKNYSEYVKFASVFVDQIMKIPNCLTIKYENLISNLDEMTSMMYTHCEIDPTHTHAEKMKSDRIFNYKQKEFLFNYNKELRKVIDMFNKVNGIKYDY